MNEKFTNIPVEPDTNIEFSSPMKWDGLDIVYQKWSWDGISAESIIFFSEDVKEMDDRALEEEIREGPLVRKDSQMTIKRDEEFTFVNFNFTSLVKV